MLIKWYIYRICSAIQDTAHASGRQLANLVFFSSFLFTWASKVRPEWHRFSGVHRMKPGRISSSSMPLSRSFRFSPGPASSVSTSSESRLSTSTVCYSHTANIHRFEYITKETFLNIKHSKLLISHKTCLTLLGIITSCWALLMHPDSNLPKITVPMS